MVNRRKFTQSERRVMSAMFKLSRWATVNEIAKWSEDMSWNTAKNTLRTLHRKRIVDVRRVDGNVCWKIKEF